ncbi:hypothetical protein OHA40_00070 [Nocardia sp. NBC_00508]|uniref:hypothetical protein n=1 Tax=Nocardia sp. NBC_00508 TaxID=2975992 RepID=UPI002E812E86|nr:hypothetical protein [Nocardia sp. NBC_00508]WUD66617.1 hypothetical protein OHA40_00070 [Nocardia sp. NBC_00508]
MTHNASSAEWMPDSCTLPTAEQPVRVAEFDRFFAESVQRTHRPTRTRLDLLLAAGAEPAARDLAARESSCCSFFTFAFDTADAGTVLHIEVPDSQVDVLDAFAVRANTAIGGGR